MEKYKNILIVGTSHISKQSIVRLKESFKEHKPEIVCLELDSGRYSSLMQNKKRSFNPRIISIVGVKGYLFAIIGGVVQKFLAKKTGMVPGIDMKTASHLAKKDKAQILLIDQNINITLRNFSKKISKIDKKNFRFDLLWGIITSIIGKNLFMKLKLKPNLKHKIINRLSHPTSELFNIKDIPNSDVVEKLIGTVKKLYPSVYKILIHDRNKFMATNLHNISLKFPDKNILAVVGAGHVSGMIELLNKYE